MGEDQLCADRLHSGDIVLGWSDLRRKSRTRTRDRIGGTTKIGATYGRDLQMSDSWLQVLVTKSITL